MVWFVLTWFSAGEAPPQIFQPDGMMLCTRCKKRPAARGSTKCERCREARKKKRNRRNRRQHQEHDLPHKFVRKLQRRLKWAAVEAYGGPECACCGVDVFEFLTIDYADHVRPSERQPITDVIYYALQEQSYPPGYQVLCCNCSTGKRLNGGLCPHKLIPNSTSVKKPVTNGDQPPVT